MYINLLTQLKNAQAVKKENIKVPYSKMDEGVVKILAANKFVESYEKKGQGPKKVLDIKLKYENGEGAINGLKFASKPSQKIYISYDEIKPVRSNYGIMVITTPKGIMSGKEAKKEKVGGMVLFKIW